MPLIAFDKAAVVLHYAADITVCLGLKLLRMVYVVLDLILELIRELEYNIKL